MNSRLHYGWMIVLCACTALIISNGLTFAGLTVFDEKILDQFGWRRSDLKLRDFLTFAIAGLLGPFVGALADRYGVKRLMVSGFLFLGLGFLLYARLSSLAMLYLIHILFAIALATAGIIVNVLLVSRWFQKKRGLALGLTLIGTSLGSMIFPTVNSTMLTNFGLSQSFLVLAFLSFAVIPIVLMGVYDHPRDKNLLPFGAARQDKHTSGVLMGMAYSQVLRNPSFWIMAAIGTMTFYCILGVSSHLFLYMRDLGYEPARAASAVGMLFTMGFVGKFLFGYLTDKISALRVFQFNLLIMLLGAVCLASMQLSMVWGFLIFFGLGWGGLYTVLQVLVVDRFGLKDSGKIIGTITTLDAIGGGLGPWLTGVLFDHGQGYGLAFALVAFLVGLGLIGALVLGVLNRGWVAESAALSTH